MEKSQKEIFEQIINDSKEYDKKIWLHKQKWKIKRILNDDNMGIQPNYTKDQLYSMIIKNEFHKYNKWNI